MVNVKCNPAQFFLVGIARSVSFCILHLAEFVSQKKKIIEMIASCFMSNPLLPIKLLVTKIDTSKTKVDGVKLNDAYSSNIQVTFKQAVTLQNYC